MRIHPMMQAILAAALFGVSAPISKLFLGEVEPVPMAAFLYLGSGVGILLYKCLQRLKVNYSNAEAQVRRTDVPWLVAAILSGGVAAPIVLMFSLRVTPASTASLLLNFEATATTLIAVLFFREAIGRGVWIAAGCITASSILLSWNANGGWGFSSGALGIICACLLWGIDNNSTRNISAKDPLSIVTIKGLVAGSFSLILAFLSHSHFPNLQIIVGTMTLGALCYGMSIVLFILAMRHLGSARTSAFFGTAPFVGAIISFILFREIPGTLFFVSLPIMVTGTVLLLTEDHQHEHSHHAAEHEYRHSHDDSHHLHEHPAAGILGGTYHSHVHRHIPVLHTHAHTPDIHHRHEH